MSLIERLVAMTGSLSLTLALLYYYDTPFFLSFLLYFSHLLSLQRPLLSFLEDSLSDNVFAGDDNSDSGSFRVKIEGPVYPNFIGGPIKISNITLSRLPNKDSVDTAFNIKIGHVSLLLSAKHYHRGKGFIQSLQCFGIRGTIDRLGFKDRPIWKIAKHTGDFQLDSFSLEDLVLDVNYPAPYKSYKLQVFHGSTISELRKEFLILDLFNSNIIGLFDGSLFSLSVPITGKKELDDKMKRNVRVLKVEDLDFKNIVTKDRINDSLSLNDPLSFIEKAKVDLHVLFSLPTVTDGEQHDHRECSETAAIDAKGLMPSVEDLLKIWPVMSTKGRQRIALNPANLGIEISFKLKNIKASSSSSPSPSSSAASDSVPLLSNMLLKPLLAYMNEHQPIIPLRSYTEIPSENLRGTITLYDSQITQLGGLALYKEFLRLLEEEKRNFKNIKKIALWSFTHFWHPTSIENPSDDKEDLNLFILNQKQQHQPSL